MCFYLYVLSFYINVPTLLNATFCSLPLINRFNKSFTNLTGKVLFIDQDALHSEFLHGIEEIINGFYLIFQFNLCHNHFPYHDCYPPLFKFQKSIFGGTLKLRSICKNAFGLPNQSLPIRLIHILQVARK